MYLPRLSSLYLLVATTWLAIATAALDSVQSQNETHKLVFARRAELGELSCRPFGTCEPCPEDELHRPYCHPYGNRRLVHCVPHTFLSEPYADASEVSAESPNIDYSEYNRYTSTNVTAADLDDPNYVGENAPHVVGIFEQVKGGAGQGKGEIPAWESCGKVVALERANYGQFVTTNTLFLIVSMFVLMLRANKLAAVQYRALAAKIGIGGSVV